MEQNLKKRYGLPTAICMVVGIVIGSGIFFKTEGVLAITGGNVLTGVLSLLIMGLIMFFCAYAFSLLAQKYEKVNGVVDYAEAVCGKKYAYYLGWFMTFIYTPGIASVLCWVTARYLCALFGFGLASGETLAVACLILVGDAFINAYAPKLAGKIQVSTTVIKLIPLVLMA
ncbi:MAG: amino acid permease, partial [Oscillospiraceae bacterium]|nr:amino acid permease [Oscillospiraceae bacterium]